MIDYSMVASATPIGNTTSFRSCRRRAFDKLEDAKARPFYAFVFLERSAVVVVARRPYPGGFFFSALWPKTFSVFLARELAVGTTVVLAYCRSYVLGLWKLPSHGKTSTSAAVLSPIDAISSRPWLVCL